MTVTEHVDHGRWRVWGRCVHCACGERLYSGGKAPVTLESQREMAEALDGLAAIFSGEIAPPQRDDGPPCLDDPAEVR